jgi:hypothetical protein
MTLNVDKCHFNMPQIEFMGHILSEHGIGVAESKVTAIREARRRQTVSEVKSVMELGRFIPNLAMLGEPLNRLMKKEQQFVWGKEQDTAFVKLKEALVSASTLAYFDVNAIENAGYRGC